MSGLIAATNAAGSDEACWSLTELNEPTPDSKGVHRIQTIKVMRGSPPPVEMRRDLGPADQFKGSEVVFIGGGYEPDTGRYWCEETVGRMVEMAERWRGGYYQEPELPKPTDLIGLYFDQPDKDRRKRKALSQFGPAARIQRS